MSTCRGRYYCCRSAGKAYAARHDEEKPGRERGKSGQIPSRRCERRASGGRHRRRRSYLRENPRSLPRDRGGRRCSVLLEQHRQRPAAGAAARRGVDSNARRFVTQRQARCATVAATRQQDPVADVAGPFPLGGSELARVRALLDQSRRLNGRVPGRPNAAGSRGSVPPVQRIPAASLGPARRRRLYPARAANDSEIAMRRRRSRCSGTERRTLGTSARPTARWPDS